MPNALAAKSLALTLTSADWSTGVDYTERCFTAAQRWVEEAKHAGLSADVTGLPVDAFCTDEHDAHHTQLLALVQVDGEVLVLTITDPLFLEGDTVVIAAREPRGPEFTYFTSDGQPT